MHSVESFKVLKKKDITFHSYYFHFSEHLHLLEFLVRSGPDVYDAYFEKKHSSIYEKLGKFSTTEQKEWKIIHKKRNKSTKKTKTIQIKSRKIQKLVLEHDRLHFQINNWRPFILEMLD